MSVIAKTLEEARNARGEVRAAGTDYSERRRHGVAHGDLVDISGIPGLAGIETGAEGARIGALATIHEVAFHEGLLRAYPGLPLAAGALATPQVRNAATMGGALLQRNRCWYYRHHDFSCYKKGGDTCPAREGNHHFGVCFDLGPCVFPHPSTLGMVLMAYDAEAEIDGKGRRKVQDLYGDGSYTASDHLLREGEVLTHIHLPAAKGPEKAAYFRSISRARAEWPLVEVVARFQLADGVIRNARLAMGGVANIPLLLPEVDAFLNGKSPGEAVFREAGEIAARGANPLPMTGYKVGLVEGTVFETLQRAHQA